MRFTSALHVLAQAWNRIYQRGTSGGGGVWHKASVSDCLPLAAPIGLSPLHILTLCGPERVLVVSTEPPDDLSCLTTPGVGHPGGELLPVPLTGCIQMHPPSPCGGLPAPALTRGGGGPCHYDGASGAPNLILQHEMRHALLGFMSAFHGTLPCPCATSGLSTALPPETEQHAFVHERAQTGVAHT